MQIALRKSWWEILCFTVFLLLVGYQIFLPPVTGLANNSDFVYVLGKLSICPADLEKQDKIYLVTDYFHDEVSCTWDTGLTTVETPLVMFARLLSRPFTGHRDFDLRALAAVHLMILLAAFGILLSLTYRAGPPIRYGIPALFILIFSDIAYTGYLNSVYLDAPAMVLLLAAAAIAIAACLNPQRWRITLAYFVLSIALVFSKAQHAILGLAFAAIAVVLAVRAFRRIFRVQWIAIATLLVASTGFMLSLTPDHYKLFALYNVIFSRLTPHALAPWDVLAEMGLGDDEMKLISSHAYRPEAPVYNGPWAENFLRRTSVAKLIAFYLHHPDVAFFEMDHDLKMFAPVLRPADMANFRQKDGYPPGAMATRFSLWSNLRSALLSGIPYHVLIFYLAPWIAWIAGWKWRRLRSPVLPAALALSAAGVMEFAMSALTDALDNARHLFMFQVLTEVMILFTVAGVLGLIVQRPAAEQRRVITRLRARWRFPQIESLRRFSWEALCLLAFLALVGYQIFIPPMTGLANNSDFLRVLGPWSICSDHQPQNNRSLVIDYNVDPGCEYDPGVATLERPIAGAALALSRIFTGEHRFDLRFLAALHFLILIAAFATLLVLTHRGPPLIRYGIPIFFILVFSDIAYTGYLNSAYTDAPAFAFLVLASAIAAVACFNHQPWLVTLAYVIAGAALIFSKSQHAPVGLLFAALALFFAWRSATRGRRWRWIGAAVLLTTSTVTMVALTPENYQLFAVYSLIFYRLTPHSETPLTTLRELGLNESDLQYVNTQSYDPGAPIYNALWAEDFLRRTSFADVILYYLRHPDVALREMNTELRAAAPIMRPVDMPNYREQDAPPGTMATRFSLWSGFRSMILRIFPYHVLLFYLAPWAVLFSQWRRRWPLLPLALVLSLAGMLAFPLATLTDAIDNARHLFMFHVITELLLILIAAAALDLARPVISRALSRRSRQAEVPSSSALQSV